MGEEGVAICVFMCVCVSRYDEEQRQEGKAAGARKRETRNGRADQALRRDGFGFEGWHNVEGGGGRIGGWLSN